MKRLQKWFAVLVCAALCLSLFSACGKPNRVEDGPAEKDFPVSIGDVVISQEPEKVAVLSANLADVILALKYEICLVAKSEACTQEALSVLPNVSADNPQQVKDTQATLVLMDAGAPQGQLEALSAAGLTVLAISPAESREDITRLYREVGSALKGAKTGYEKGERIATQLFMSIDDISRMIPSSDTPVTVSYVLDTEGGAVTGDTLQGKLIEASGLINAVEDGTANQVGVDALRLTNPRYIFCPTGLKTQLASSGSFQDLDAVKEGRVYEMDPNWMALQGESMVQAVMFMAGTVYPELVNQTEDPSSSAASGSSSGGASSGSSQQSGATLKKGDQSDEVMRLQERLDELGYMFVPPTGFYGDATVEAVKGFQIYNGMSATGEADEKMQGVLYSDSAVANPNPD